MSGATTIDPTSARRRVRIGLVGCGSIAEWRHLPAIIDEVDDLEVVALCDTDQVRRDRLARKYNIARAYPEIDILLREADVEAVDIAAPHKGGLRLAMIRACACAGKHVFVEKPLAWSVEEAKEIQSAVESAGIKLQVGFMKRFYYGYRIAKDLLASSKLGSVSALSIRYWFGPSFHTLADLVIENAIHMLDLARYFGGPIKETQSFMHKVQPTAEEKRVRGTILTRVGFSNGAVGSILLSSLMSWRVPDELVEIIGTDASVHIFNGQRVTLTKPPRKPEEEPQMLYWEPPMSSHTVTGNNLSGYTNQFQAFARCILEDGTPVVPVEEGIAAQETATEILESLDGKK